MQSGCIFKKYGSKYLVFLLLLSVPLLSQTPLEELTFDHITINDGLSHYTVFAAAQDTSGFLWFGTANGLDRYDGYKFKSFRHDPGDTNSLSDNYITSLCITRSNAIWIGTEFSGLNRFEPAQERFVRYQRDTLVRNGINDDEITSIVEDSSGFIWIGTRKGGLNRFDPRENLFVHYRHKPQDSSSLSYDNIKALYIDRQNTLWIGTAGGGLNHFDRNTGIFHRFRHAAGDEQSISSDSVNCILQDHEGIFWVGTSENGLDRYNPCSGQWKNFFPDPSSSDGPSTNDITKLFEDRRHFLWIGTDGGGLDIFNPSTNHWQRCRYDPNNPKGISHKAIECIFEDRNRLLWIGTYGAGISTFNFKKKPFSTYLKNSLGYGNVSSFIEDRGGNLWIGTDGGGLIKQDNSTEQFTIYNVSANKSRALTDNAVLCLSEDDDGSLLVGTYRGGLNRLDPLLGSASVFKRSMSLSPNFITSLVRDSSNNLWIGMYKKGLWVLPVSTGSPYNFFSHLAKKNKIPYINGPNIRSLFLSKSNILWIGTLNEGAKAIDLNDTSVTEYKCVPGDPVSLSHNCVLCFAQSSDTCIWIGTASGLNRLNIVTGKARRYSRREGLPDEMIYGLLEDEHTNLWISTNNGLCYFNPQSDTFKTYYGGSGIQSNQFNYGAFYKTRNGAMCFGGINGFTLFHPDSLLRSIDSFSPTPVITDFKIANRSVPIGSTIHHHQILDRSIVQTEAITLPYQVKEFSFEFASLNYASRTTQYFYKMDGFDKEWVHAGDLPIASYSALPSWSWGFKRHYTFKVKSINDDGIGSSGVRSVAINILPPPWGFMLINSAALLFGIYCIIALRLKIIKKEKKLLELKVEERTNKLQLATNELELANVKLRKQTIELEHLNNDLVEKEQFALLGRIHGSIAHEIRNPLSGIYAPLENLEKHLERNASSNEHTAGCFSRIYTYLDRIEEVIKNFLQFYSSDSMHTEVLDFTDIFQSLREVFSIRKPSRIDLEFYADPSLRVTGNRNAVVHILMNLIFNSIDAISDSGTISVSAEKDSGKTAVLRIRDSGCGIPEEQAQDIFKPFYTSKKTRKNIGLGMVIVKDLTQKMGWQIVFRSQEGQGTEVNLLMTQGGS
ncbi:MAG: ATP-binding protein [Chitinivibrionales bacterium]|nr:ATP-binding protein [Chitinivibrionales bacterium]